MAAPLKAAMPENLDLPDGYMVEWAAINPTTGADVAGVVVNSVSIFGTTLGAGSAYNAGDVGNPILLGVSA